MAHKKTCMIRAEERPEDTSVTNCRDGNVNFKISRAQDNAGPFLSSSRNFIQAQRCWPWCGRNDIRYLNNFNCRCRRSAARAAPVLLTSDCKVNPSYRKKKTKKRMFQLEPWGEITHTGGQHSHLRIRITNLPPSIYYWQKKVKILQPTWKF